MYNLILITILLFSNHASAWTLSTSSVEGFENNEIDIFIANSDCTGAGFSTSEYGSLIKSAVKKFWNSVPTSSLYLDVQGIKTDIDITNDTHDSALPKVPVNSILAGCNGNIANGFDDGSILGSAQVSCTSSDCRAVLILNSHANSYLKNKSDSDIEIVIAHELGHAFGLGHSEYKHNLMYYSISGKYQKWLGMDDINGVSYLYPHDSEFDLLGIPLIGNCGSLDFNGSSENKSSFGISFLGGIFLIFGLAFIRRVLFV